jgi:hypothetical protein
MTELVRETAHVFGFQRRGQGVENSMRSGIGLLVRKGGAKEEGGVVVHVGR